MTHIWPLPLVEFLALDEIEEYRPVVLVHTAREWEAVRADLRGLQIAQQVEVHTAVMPHWMEHAGRLLGEVRKLEDPVLYAVGEQLAVDSGKYFSQQTGLPLICCPTALTSDSLYTPSSSVRHDGCVEAIETRPPDRVVVDFDVLAAAPEPLRAAGMTCVLSIATALWDWEYAEEMGMNPEGMELVPWAADNALSLLQAGLDCAEAAGAGDPAGLRQLLDCLALEVQLCNQLGHTRPVEGSEHAFAYAVENLLAEPLTLGERLAAGILLMAGRQDQEIDELETALAACHIHPDAVPQQILRQTLAGLPAYVRAHDLPFGIAHETEEEE